MCKKSSISMCSVEGCHRLAAYGFRGMCQSHRREANKNGGRLFAEYPKKGQVKAFIAATLEAARKGSNACIVWPFGRLKGGYGGTRYKGKTQHAHRALFALFHGNDVPPDMWCLHTCGNGHLACVNPNHVYLGTNIENVADRTRDGRQAYMRGELHGLSSFSNEQVCDILRMYAHMRIFEIADSLGRHPSTISRIITGDRWISVSRQFYAENPEFAPHPSLVAKLLQ